MSLSNAEKTSKIITAIYNEDLNLQCTETKLKNAKTE